MAKRLRIDRAHTAKLLQGEPVTIKVPPGARELTIVLVVPDGYRNYLAEVIDTFFNGRPARN